MMTIKVLTCDKCGKSLRIESDDDKYREKRKANFLKDHEKCQNHDTK